jgi:hypothetical protein
MNIEKIYQLKFFFINGNVEDKNKNIPMFLEFFRNNNYFLEHKITLIVTSLNNEDNSINIIDDTNYESQGVLRIINSTDEVFERLFKIAHVIVINSANEGLDLNLVRALKFGKSIYINPNHTFFKSRLFNQKELNQLNVHKINSNDPRYKFENQQNDEHTDKFYDYLTDRDEPFSVSIKKLIKEIMEIKS